MKGRGLHIYALCYLLFLYAPILLLPIFAFNNGTVIALPPPAKTEPEPQPEREAA